LLELLRTILTGELLYPIVVCAVLFLAVGVATMWAVCCSRHWFLKTTVVGAALAPALLIPGYDLVLVFAIQATVLWVLLTLTKIRRIRALRRAGPEAGDQAPALERPRFRFTLSDLLLMTAAISAVLAVASRVPAAVWAEWKGIGLLGLVCALYSALIPDTVLFVSGRERLGTYPAGKKKKRGRIAVVLVSILYPLMICLVMLFLCPAAAIFHFVIHPTPIPPITLPDPNGYDDLVAAGSRLVNGTVPNVDEATAAELGQFVAKHGHVLDEARKGLARECQVPLTYTQADLARTDNRALRELSRAFLAEGKLAEWEGRTEDAVEDYLDVMRLGTACTQGGLLVDAFTGWALHEMGIQALAPLTEELNADQCRRAIELARSIEANREPLDELLARQTLWDEHGWGKMGRALEATGLDFEHTEGPWLEECAVHHQAKMRLLICELAVRQYRVEHQREPETLADLVSDCLPELLIDPYTGKPLVYRRTDTGHLLYSVGPDRVDDRGEPIDWSLGNDDPRGDLLLEEPEREEPGGASARAQ